MSKDFTHITPIPSWLSDMGALRLLSNDLDELLFESSQSCLDKTDSLLAQYSDGMSEFVRAVLLVHNADCRKHLGQYKKSLDLCRLRRHG